MSFSSDKVLGFVCHVSASTWGDRQVIDQWHRDRGFSQIGYHAVILNGVRSYQAAYDIELDGRMEEGRPENVMGAHCLAKRMNSCTIGVCCVGNPGWPLRDVEPAPKELIQRKRHYLTERQLVGLVDWLARSCERYGLDPEGTFGRPGDGKEVGVITQHSDHDRDKPFCASIVMPELRSLVAARLAETAAVPAGATGRQET